MQCSSLLSHVSGSTAFYHPHRSSAGLWHGFAGSLSIPYPECYTPFTQRKPRLAVPCNKARPAEPCYIRYNIWAATPDPPYVRLGISDDRIAMPNKHEDTGQQGNTIMMRQLARTGLISFFGISTGTSRLIIRHRTAPCLASTMYEVSVHDR